MNVIKRSISHARYKKVSRGVYVLNIAMLEPRNCQLFRNENIRPSCTHHYPDECYSLSAVCQKSAYCANTIWDISDCQLLLRDSINKTR